MRNPINRWCLGVLAALSVTACSEQEQTVSGQGTLAVSLTEKVQVGVETRAVPFSLPQTPESDFNLTVTNTVSGKEVYAAAYAEEIPVQPGTYRVTASWGTEKLNTERPYYKGTSDEVEVESDKTTPVPITCHVANVLVSVDYTDPELFDDVYDVYAVDVKVGSQTASLGGATKIIYFPAETPVSFSFRYRKKGETVTTSIPLKSLYEELPASFPAATHVRFTLSVQNFGLAVTKMETEPVTVSETIPVAWLPKPRISTTGFDDDNTLSVIETESASAALNLTLPAALQDMKFSFGFEDAHLGLSADKEYLLSTDKEELERALGIELPAVGTTESGVVSLDELIERLQTNGGTPTSNTMKVSVQTNDRWSDEAVCVLKCEKPEFRVSVYPGNIWTKEFTMNPLAEEEVISGNYDKLSEDMSYQCSTDQTTWQLMDGLTANQLLPGTKYYVRGLYRGAVPGEVMEMETYPIIALENGGLEDYSVSGKDGSALAGYGAVYSWNGWGTLNELTCDYCLATAYAYNTRSGTRPISGGDAYQGNSVWIATIGWGYGGTIFGSKKQTPGELFIGTLSDVNHDKDTCTKNYGMSFVSHPTALRFYYKYLPYDSDTSDILIQLLHDDIVLGEGVLQQSSEISTYTECNLALTYNEDALFLVPNRLVIVFKSGFNTSVKSYGNSGLNGVHFVGSQLFIDDVELIYDK